VNGDIASIKTPQSVQSSSNQQVPVNIKEEPVSSVQPVESARVAPTSAPTPQEDSKQFDMKIDECQDKIITKQEFYLKQSFDGGDDLRVSALYSFDYENDLDKLRLPSKRYRRTRECGLFGEHYSTIVKQENMEDIDEKNNNILNNHHNDLNGSCENSNHSVHQNGTLEQNSELNKLLSRPMKEDPMDTTKKILGGKRLREDSSMDDEIFSSFHSPEEDLNDAFQQPHTPSKYTTSLLRDDHEHGSMINHQLGPAELSIMYPTPPSLEAMVQSPCSTFIPAPEVQIKSEPESSIERKEKYNLPDEYKVSSLCAFWGFIF